MIQMMNTLRPNSGISSDLHCNLSLKFRQRSSKSWTASLVHWADKACSTAILASSLAASSMIPIFPKTFSLSVEVLQLKYEGQFGNIPGIAFLNAKQTTSLTLAFPWSGLQHLLGKNVLDRLQSILLVPNFYVISLQSISS